MEKRRNPVGVLIFSLLTFIPLYLLLLIFLLDLMPRLSWSGDVNAIKVQLWVWFGLFAYEIVVTFICFDKYICSEKSKKRLFIMSVGWFFMLFPIIFLFLNALGGISMAVVDSTNSYVSRLPGYISFSLFWSFCGSLVFLPWNIISNFIITKFFSGILVRSQ